MTSLALLLGILLGQTASPVEHTVRQADLVVLYTRNISGYLSTCGCSGKAAQTLANTTALARQWKAISAERTLLVDGGNIGRERKVGGAVWEYFLAAGYDLVAPGPAETDWAQDYWDLVATRPLPVVVAPGVASSGLAWLVTTWTRQLGPQRVAVLSTGPRTDAAAAEVDHLAAALRAARASADVVLLVSHLDGETETAALRGPWAGLVDAVLGSTLTDDLAVRDGVVRRLPTPKPLTELGVACFTRKAEGVGWRVDCDAVAVAEEQGDPGVATSVAATLKLLEGDLLSNGLVQPEAAFTSRGHIGPAQCQPCHQSAVERWSASRHANAVAILTQRSGLRADCLTCHSTAYAQWSAIRPLQSGPQGIECVTCHEGARRHLANPRAGTISKGSRSVCMTCHTRSTDPSFDFAKRWAVIAHGANPKP